MTSINKDILNYSFKVSADLIGIKEESFIRIFSKYINNFEEKVAQLKTHIKNNDFKSTTELSHSLKGASGNLNLPSLAELFRTIEINSKEKKPLSFNNELEKIETIYCELKKITKT